ncbi:hypothetical protein H0X09_01905 [Candidatus Saccharibacteria bacterium]|nr:hypothetical protein [Candidatus Saccharibacteria bacterium]
MSETLQASNDLEQRHQRLDEIRRGSEVLIDDIFLEIFRKDGAITDKDGYIQTTTQIESPFGNETIRGVYSVMELKHGKGEAEDHYQLTIRDQIDHQEGVTQLNEVTYHFKEDWVPLTAEGLNSDGEPMGWEANRGEELDLQLYLTQTLQSIQERSAIAA